MLKILKEINDPFGVLESTKEVVEKAKYVSLNKDAGEKLALLVDEKIKEGLGASSGSTKLTKSVEEEMQLTFIQNSINYCFWAEKGQEKWKVEWPEGTIVSGGWYGVIAVFERALSKGVPILDAGYLSKLTIEDTKELFKSASSSEIPLLKERYECLREVGEVLSAKFGGKFINLVGEEEYDAVRVVKSVHDNFPLFRDKSDYDGEKVLFLKRAQVVANGLSYVDGVEIKNAGKLTAFADYKIPQILRHFGVIEYSKELSEKIDNYILIPEQSIEEIEIRAATVQGVELIRERLGKYSSDQIDNAIWLISQDQSKVDKPYHRTYSIFY